MSRLSTIRPSNLVLLAAAPFIIYLFATSSKYLRSLIAILGIGNNAGPVFVGFLLIVSVAILGYLCARYARFTNHAPRLVACFGPCGAARVNCAFGHKHCISTAFDALRGIRFSFMRSARTHQP